MNALTLALTHNLTNASKIILKQAKSLDLNNQANANCLLLAIEKLDIDLVKQLLEQGLDPNNAKDLKSGETSLHLLMYKMCYSRLPDYLKDEDPSTGDGATKIKKTGSRQRAISRYDISQEDVAKCEKIFELLLKHKVDI